MILVKDKRKRKQFIIIFSIILGFTFLVGVCAGYVSDYYRADLESIEAFSPMNKVSINTYPYMEVKIKC